MKLIELVEKLDSFEEESIIFQEDRDDYNSDVIIGEAEEGDGGEKIIDGRKYSYLIEIFLAKEFLEDWLPTLKSKPTTEQIAKRLYEYAIYDA